MKQQKAPKIMLIFSALFFCYIIGMILLTMIGEEEVSEKILPFSFLFPILFFVVVFIIIISTIVKSLKNARTQNGETTNNYSNENVGGRDYSYHWDDKPTTCFYCNYEVRDNKFNYCPICGNKLIKKEKNYE